jgi:hypothetical protein
VKVSKLRVGETELDVVITRAEGAMRVDLASRGPAVDLAVILPVPLGARDVSSGVGGVNEAGVHFAGDRRSPDVTWSAHDGRIAQVLQGITSGGTFTVDVRWTGGLSVAAPLVDLVPGQASHGVRVVDFTAGTDGGWTLELEGEAGLAYDVRLFGEAPSLEAAEGATAEILVGVGEGDSPHLARVRFPDGHGRHVATLRLAPAR